MSLLRGPERWRDVRALESTGDLETRSGSGRAPDGLGRGMINAEACHFVSASAGRGCAGRGARPRMGRPAGVQGRGSQTAAEARGRRGGGAGEVGARGQVCVGGRPLRELLGPGAVCRGPRGLVRGCMPPHASGWAPPGRNSAPGARGRQEAERAGAGRAARGCAGGGWGGPWLGG